MEKIDDVKDKQAEDKDKKDKDEETETLDKVPNTKIKRDWIIIIIKFGV